MRGDGRHRSSNCQATARQHRCDAWINLAGLRTRRLTSEVMPTTSRRRSYRPPSARCPEPFFVSARFVGDVMLRSAVTLSDF